MTHRVVAPSGSVYCGDVRRCIWVWFSVETLSFWFFISRRNIVISSLLCSKNKHQPGTRSVRLGPVRFGSVRRALWMLPFHNVGLFSKPNRFGSAWFGSVRPAVWMSPKCCTWQRRRRRFKCHSTPPVLHIVHIGMTYCCDMYNVRVALCVGKVAQRFGPTLICLTEVW